VNEPAERSSFLRSSPHPGSNPVPPECHPSALTTAPHSRLISVRSSESGQRTLPVIKGKLHLIFFRMKTGKRETIEYKFIQPQAHSENI
jgi:hypothetical protein